MVYDWVGIHTVGVSRRKERAMQKWEYLFIAGAHHKGAWRPRLVDGEELRDWKRGPTIMEFSNKPSKEGWELVNLATTGYLHDTYRLTFKRPIPE
jgi:hypothetical protein